MNKPYQDISEARLEPTSEKSFAQWRRDLGKRVIEKDGVFWEEIKKGFFQPTHLLARLKADQVRRPAVACWGYRAALRDEDDNLANGAIVVHQLPNFANYDISLLPSNRRKQLRRFMKCCEVVQLTSPRLLEDQGYEVLCSSISRSGYRALPAKRDYLRSCSAFLNPGDNSRVVIAGLLNGRLGGYMEISAVSGIVYSETQYTATEALSSHMGAGLYYEFVQMCRRSPEVGEIVSGQHAPEARGLDVFKKDIGLEVRRVPSRHYLLPTAGMLLRRTFPHKYYRLTGLG